MENLFRDLERRADRYGQGYIERVLSSKPEQKRFEEILGRLLQRDNGWETVKSFFLSGRHKMTRRQFGVIKQLAHFVVKNTEAGIGKKYLSPEKFIAFLQEMAGKRFKVPGFLIGVAAEAGNTPYVEYLCQTHHSDLRLDDFGFAPTVLGRVIQCAPLWRVQEITKELLKAGADPSAGYPFHAPLYLLASQYCQTSGSEHDYYVYFDIASLLIKSGADVEAARLLAERAGETAMAAIITAWKERYDQDLAFTGRGPAEPAATSVGAGTGLRIR
ncbi:MAG TPA: hypothetical protein VJB02_05225 [Coxiellaceae bacterium]|nr:hypothetical protein [Coxiellaceae bacterium]